ncbi:MAG: hypothetical protein ACM3O9_03965 [Methylocystaceae bacterium]
MEKKGMMEVFPDYLEFVNKNELIGIVGLGYVGLPLAVLLSKLYRIIGYDDNLVRIDELQNQYDRTGQITSEVLQQTNIEYTSQPDDLKRARMIIIAVPTPVTPKNLPDLSPLQAATAMVGSHLVAGTTKNTKPILP